MPFSCSVKFKLLAEYGGLVFTHQPENRRVSLTYHQAEEISFSKLECTAKMLFGIPDSDQLHFTWIDTDGDEVIMSSQNEFEEYLRIKESQSGFHNTLQFGVITKMSGNKDNSPLNQIRLNVVKELKCVFHLKNSAKKEEAYRQEGMKAYMAKKLVIQDNIKYQTIYKSKVSNGDELANRGSTEEVGVGDENRHYSLEVKSSQDTHKVPPNSAFRHEWVIKNNSHFDIKYGVRIMFSAGEKICDNNFSPSVGPLRKSGERVIAVNMTSPPGEGRYTSSFRFVLPSGVVILQPLEVTVDCDKKYKGKKAKLLWSSLVPRISDRPRLVEPYKPFEGLVASEIPNSISKSRVGFSKTLLEIKNQTFTGNKEGNKLWKTELDLLTQLGFSDVDTVISLLEKYAVVSNTSINGFRISKEALKSILTELLALSNSADW